MGAAGSGRSKGGKGGESVPQSLAKAAFPPMRDCTQARKGFWGTGVKAQPPKVSWIDGQTHTQLPCLSPHKKMG